MKDSVLLQVIRHGVYDTKTYRYKDKQYTKNHWGVICCRLDELENMYIDCEDNFRDCWKECRLTVQQMIRLDLSR